MKICHSQVLHSSSIIKTVLSTARLVKAGWRWGEMEINLLIDWQRLPGAPQSQQLLFPGIRLMSSVMARVRSSTLLSPPPPPLLPPSRATLRASCLLLLSTEIQLNTHKQTCDTFNYHDCHKYRMMPVRLIFLTHATHSASSSARKW